MRVIDKLTDKYIKILEERFDKELFIVGDDQSDDDTSDMNSITLYYNNDAILEINIIFFYDTDEDDDKTDNIEKEEYQIHINQPLDDYFSKENPNIVYDNEIKFYWIVLGYINDLIRYEYYDNYHRDSDTELGHLLDTLPIFDIDEYNDFVDNVISEKSYLWCFVNKKVLNTVNKEKFNYLTQASNFNIL